MGNATDLVVVGGTTEAHRMTEPVSRFFYRIGNALVMPREQVPAGS